MNTIVDTWKGRAAHWDDWKNTPLRPNEQEVLAFEQVATGRSLMLGATLELRHLVTDFADLVENGIDWFNMPFDDGVFDSIIGDGVTMLAGPDVIEVALKKVRSGGTVAFRVFLRNDDPVLSPLPAIRKFQQLTKSYVPVQEIYDRIGSSPTTDDYNNSSDVYWLPTIDELPTPSRVIYQNYQYAQFYPIVVWTA